MRELTAVTCQPGPATPCAQELLKADLAAFGPQHSATVAARGVLAEMTAALGRAVRLLFARRRHYQDSVHVLGCETYHASRPVCLHQHGACGHHVKSKACSGGQRDCFMRRG